MKKQNYKESKLILEKITKARRILINCHRGPDPDAIGSALALMEVLNRMNKEVLVICPSEKLHTDASFLKGFNKIKTNVNFRKFRFVDFDLFLTLDSSSWEMVSSDPSIKVPEIPMIVVDHHYTNKRYGTFNLVDKTVSATGELLFLIFEDWGSVLTKDAATALLTGIIGDTGVFKYPNTTKQTFEIVGQLIEKGAQRDKIIASLYRSSPYNLIKFWGEALKNLNIDTEHKFVYSAVSFNVFKRLGYPDNAKETSVDLFGQITKGTEFGFMAIEREKGELSISFRSRLNFDTSKVALDLGGGGHPAASGASVKGLPFKEAVEKVLKVSRKHAKEYLSKI